MTIDMNTRGSRQGPAVPPAANLAEYTKTHEERSATAIRAGATRLSSPAVSVMAHFAQPAYRRSRGPT